MNGFIQQAIRGEEKRMKTMTVHVSDEVYRTWEAICKIHGYRDDCQGLSHTELETVLLHEALDLMWEHTTEWLEMLQAGSKDKQAVQQWRAERELKPN
jgi:hypothetical protein